MDAGRKGQESLTNVGVRVPKDLYERFRVVSRSRSRSISGEVRRLIAQAVEEAEKREAA